MRVETKFNINDTVWIMKDNKSYSFGIWGISIHVSAYPTDYYGMGVSQSITYSDFGNHVSVKESNCFASKEELLASL